MSGDTSYSVNVHITGLEEIKEKVQEINMLIFDIENHVQKLAKSRVRVTLEPMENGHEGQGNG